MVRENLIKPFSGGLLKNIRVPAIRVPSALNASAGSNIETPARDIHSSVHSGIISRVGVFVSMLFTILFPVDACKLINSQSHLQGAA
jgi:hypothetical protein